MYYKCVGLCYLRNTWSYEDMKGVPPEVVQHTIPIRDDAKPVQQRPYDMNPKYETIVKEEIDKLLDAGFI